MKKFPMIFSLALLFSAALTLTSCGGNAAADAAQETEQTEATTEAAAQDHADHADHTGHDHDAQAHGEGPEFTSAYVCPMHCSDSGSDQPGQCPACGMDYVAQADHVQDGHVHE